MIDSKASKTPETTETQTTEKKLLIVVKEKVKRLGVKTGIRTGGQSHHCTLLTR